MSLEQLIKNKKAKVTIIGLGYVGLPTAFELAKVGYQVFGIDKDKEKVDFINQGKSYIKDINSKELKKIVSSKKLKVYDSYKVLKD